MKHPIILNILIIIFSFSSCNGKKKVVYLISSEISNAISLIRVDSSPLIIDNNKHEIIPHDDINPKIKDIKYIPLKSIEPIGGIDQVATYKDRIYILDAYKSESIYIFDFSGSLIKIIHSKGGGPEEYAGLNDLCISEKDNELIINDRLALYMLHYSLNGDFIKKVKCIPNFFFETMADKYINQLTFRQSFSENVNFNIVISSGDSVTRKGFPSYPLQIDAANSKSLHYNYKGELLFSPNLSDTIYQIINDSTYSIKYVINQEKSIWRKKDEALNNNEYRDLVIKSGYTYLGKPILENSNYLSYPICSGNNDYIQQKVYWYDKKSKSSFIIGERRSETSSIIAYIPGPQTIYNDYFVGAIGAEDIEYFKTYIEQGNNIELIKDEKLKSIFQQKIDNLECIIVLYAFE